MSTENPKSGLLVIDFQNDFCKGGSLAVEGAEDIIESINEIKDYFSVVVFSKDVHPENHISFFESHHNKKVGDIIKLENGKKQKLWPKHCIRDSPGCELHNGLQINQEAHTIFEKGTKESVALQNKDSYSAFLDNTGNDTGLKNYFESHEITTLYICGLTTEYCVKRTVLDAIKLTFETYLVKDCIRGLDPIKSKKAKQKMKTEGCNIISKRRVVESRGHFTENQQAKKRRKLNEI